MHNELLTKNPYFNTSGMTSSQANYVCECIKEILKPIQDEVNDLQTHTAHLLENGVPTAMDSFKKVEHIDDKLAYIGQLYAISAFLRTAIKEKEKRLTEINHHMQDVRGMEDRMLEPIDIMSLENLRNVDMDDYLLTLPLSDVIAYKTAESKAAHIGKFIHNFDEIRTLIRKKEKVSFKQVGEQVFKIYHTPLYDMDELQSLQQYLLAEHRIHENTVNLYKARFREFDNQAQVRYEEELNRRQNERNQKLNERVQAKMEALSAIKSQIADFKIIIPNEFKDTIAELLATG